MHRFIYIVILTLSMAINANAQSDTTSVATPSPTPTLEGTLKAEKEQKVGKAPKDWSTWHPSAKKATWIALIPGAGQIYNRKYWKLPIFYGGFMGCFYALRWNGQMYNDYANAYKDIMDDDPNTHRYDQFLHLGSQIDESNKSRYQNIFKMRKDRFRRYRDISVFAMIAVYGLSIIDAYVDASLSEFDISDDLSLQVSPAIFNSRDIPLNGNALRNSAMGINCSLNF